MKINLSSDSYVFKVLSCFLNLWCYTLRFIEVFPGDWKDEIEIDKHSIIYALWHDEFLPLAFFHKKKGIYAIVSPSRDGEILACFLKLWGYNLFRGSSHKNPIRLIKEVIHHMKKRNIGVAIAVDGPTGPRHEVKKGVIYLAYKTRSLIMPLRVKFSNSIKLNSWDRFQIPLPFSKCKLIYGRPYFVSSIRTLNLEVEKLKNKLSELNGF